MRIEIDQPHTRTPEGGRHRALKPQPIAPLPDEDKAPKSTGKTLVIVLLSTSTLAASIWAGGATLALSKSTGRVPTAYVVPTVTITARSTVTASPKSAKPATSSVTVDDGTWVVSEDIPAGRYKVTAPVTDDCYWSITKSGTNGSDIIENDVPGGGRPAVVLRKGHDFHSRDCGKWAKQ